MTDEKYNGWVNYETWLMNLNLTNTECINEELENIAKNSNEDDYDTGDLLQNWVEETFNQKENGLEEIIKINDCWTTRDFQKIHWDEIIHSVRSEWELAK